MITMVKLQTHNTCWLFAYSILSTTVLFSGLQVFTHLKYYPNEFLLYPKERKGSSVSEILSNEFMHFTVNLNRFTTGSVVKLGNSNIMCTFMHICVPLFITNYTLCY